MTDRIFRLFVSSTFADFTAEREILRNEVFPRLRQLCLDLGTQFEPVDMRWGVSAEAAQAQDAMVICLRELRRCLSTGLCPSLLILLGDRYGSRLLPDEIDASTFERIAQYIGTCSGPRAEATIRRYYPLDKNSLKPIHRLNFEETPSANNRKLKALVKKIRALLDAGAECLPAELQQQLNASATEREIEEGLRLSVDAKQAFCIIRTLSGPGKRKQPWIDVEEGKIDRDSARSASCLKRQVRARLGKRAIGLQAKLNRGSLDSSYRKRFKRTVFKHLSDDIRSQILAWKDETALDREIAAHQRFAEARSQDFTGRRESREQIANYLGQSQRQPLVINGKSGMGKSALVAVAVRDFLKTQPKARVVQRFIGATPRSSNGDSFLSDLFSELQKYTGSKAKDVVPNSRRLVSKLNQLISRSRGPLVLVIDALNQIPEGDLARDLRWLPTELPENVWLIVSAVIGSFAMKQLERMYPDRTEILLGELTEDEGARLLNRWLARSKRRLQPSQSAEILRAFAECKSPLYLRVVANQAARIRSTDPIYRPGKTVDAVIGWFLDRLCLGRNHGRQFVEHSLAYIAVSRYGLSHEEVRRALWEDLNVRKEYLRRYRRSPKLIGTVAPLVWAQLYHELSDYVTLRTSQGEELMTFFHDQVREAVELRFVRSQRVERHGQLAQLFAAKHGRPFVSRAYSELAYQLCSAGEWLKTDALFRNAAFIDGALRELGTEPLVKDIDLVLERGRRYLEDHSHIEALRRALAQSSHVLDRGRGEVAAQLLGRLRTHDHPSTVKLLRGLRRMEQGIWLEPIGDSLKGSGLSRVLDLRNFDSDAATSAETSDEERVSRVWDLHLCSDQRTILTALHDGTVRVWDVVTGRLLAVLTGHDGDVSSVCSTPDGRYAISAASDGYVIVWDLAGMVLLRKLKSPKAETAVAALPNGNRFISGSVDGRIRIWDIDGHRKPRTLGKGHKYYVWRLAVSKTGKKAVSTSQDGIVQLWNLRSRSNRIIIRTAEKSNLFRAAQLTADGRYCISADGDGNIFTTKLSSGKSLFAPVHTAVIRDVELTKDQRKVISVSQSGQLAISGVLNQRVSTRMDAHGDEVNTVDLASDGRTLFTGASDGIVKVWDLPTLRQWRRYPQHHVKLVGITTANHGKVVISGDASGHIHLWHAHSGGHIKSFFVRNASLRGLSATSDGRKLVFVTGAPFEDEYTHRSGHHAAKLHVWDLRSGERWSIYTGNRWRENAFALTPDEKHILAATDDEDVTIFSLHSGQPILKLRNAGHHIAQILVTSDSRRAVIKSFVAEDYGRARLLLFDLRLGKRERVLVEDADKTRSSVLRGREQLLTGSADGKVRQWSLTTGNMIRSFRAHSDGVTSLVLMSDGRRILTVGGDHEIKLSDINGRTQPATVGLERGLEHVSFSPRGQLCIGWTKHWSLHVWHLKSKKRLASFTANDKIGYARVLPDERTIVLAEVTGALHFLRFNGLGRSLPGGSMLF